MVLYISLNDAKVFSLCFHTILSYFIRDFEFFTTLFVVHLNEYWTKLLNLYWSGYIFVSVLTFNIFFLNRFSFLQFQSLPVFLFQFFLKFTGRMKKTVSISFHFSNVCFMLFIQIVFISVYGDQFKFGVKNHFHVISLSSSLLFSLPLSLFLLTAEKNSRIN